LTVALSVVGARPNFIKLAALRKPLARSFKHVIVHTGQHYDFEMSKIFFKHLKIPKPDYNLEVGSGPQGYQLGEMVKRVERSLLNETPSLVIVYGDTNSTLAGALSSVKLQIPVAHIEAGLRSYDMKMPEEVNRRLTDQVSQYLFAPTETAVKSLKREHVRGKIYLSGDVMVDILRDSLKLAEERSRVLDKLELEPERYFLATIHRAENTDTKQRLRSIIQALTKLKEVIVFPAHPRTRKALREFNLCKRIRASSNLKLIEPLGYLDFINLERNASKILTDSGGVQKEAYLLGIPCITLRDRTEWVETVREGWNILVDVNVETIVEAVRKFNPEKPGRQIFGKAKASERIAEILRKELA
jgi:UDP-N-acetylglucosamine 2-epimerase (non-hydrolysing)